MPAAHSDPPEAGPVAESEHDAEAGADVGPVRRPRLATDTARVRLAVAITIVLALGYGIVVGIVQPQSIGSLGFLATVYFGAWSVYSLLYTALTWTVLGPADGVTLRDWLSENRAGRRRRQRAEWWWGSGGPLGAVSTCALAIGAVVVAAVVPELRREPLVIVLAVLVVTTSWLLITTVFTVHYAREDILLGGLRFTGTEEDGPPRLTDYWYLAVQVSTAYSGADVAVTNRAMRRVVTAHAVVAFVFTTVLIALLVSLLLTLAA